MTNNQANAARKLQALRRIASQGLAALIMPGQWVTHNYDADMAADLVRMCGELGFTSEAVPAALSNDQKSIRVKWEANA